MWKIGESVLNSLGSWMNDEKTRIITDLMSKLNREQNCNLFDIVDFLNTYSSEYHKDSDVKIIMDNYHQLIRKINNYDYKKKTEEKLRDEYQIPNIDNVFYAYKHSQMIENFNKLSGSKQQNIIDLTWFILYCRTHKLDHPDKHSKWKRYSDLIEEIKNFSDCENGWI